MVKKLLIIIILTSLLVAISANTANHTKSISLNELEDKIRGGWAGQMIGVGWGAPTEFRSLQKIIAGDLPSWSRQRVLSTYKQDDLILDVILATTIDEKGINATTEDFAATYKTIRRPLWHANLAGLRALQRGVSPMLSGTPQYNVHANDIDFQIEADFIGLTLPGMLRTTNDMGVRVGRIMNHGDGIAGGLFVSGMYAAAFFENDPRKVVEAGLACLPAKSGYAQVIADVLKWSRENPDDWQKVWHLIGEKYDRDDPCPDGALRPFNIDAKLNGSYIALGLLYGKGDFRRTMEVSMRSGQDSDCNPSSAAGVLGVMLGYKNIPAEWTKDFPSLAKEKFIFTDMTFDDVIARNVKRTIAAVKQFGGKLDGDNLTVKMQTPQPAKLDLWDNYGKPTERIAATDARWQWKGVWTEKSTKRDDVKITTIARLSGEKNAEAAITFNGTGVEVIGPYFPTGGTADVYIDGKLARTVDVYLNEDDLKAMFPWSGFRPSENVFHQFGLKDGQHTLRLVVRGAPVGIAQGTEIAIEDIVIFR